MTELRQGWEGEIGRIERFREGDQIRVGNKRDRNKPNDPETRQVMNESDIFLSTSSVFLFEALEKVRQRLDRAD